MDCAEFEIALAEYIDETLAADVRSELEAHAATCAGCREFMTDAIGAVAVLERMEEATPPPELLTKLAYLAPLGRTRTPFEQPGAVSRFLIRWLQPVLQPRLAMGMAMTVLSFTMLGRCTGIPVQRIQAADLNPVRVWGNVEDKAVRTKDRVVKYYENLKLVYEIETRLKDLQDQQDTSQSGKAVAGAKRSGNGADTGQNSGKATSNQRKNQ
jgi:hypothetical protein